MKIKRVWLLRAGIVVVALALMYVLASKVIPNVLVSVSRAGVGTRVSFADSYVIGERLLARADGEDKCKVNVFLMDEQGRSVPGRRVMLAGMGGIVEPQGMSNKNGQVVYEMVSDKEGQFGLKATVEGVEIPQTVTVTFRD